jgi:hypothetical protein
LVNVHEIGRRLSTVTEDLLKLASIPPDVPLASEDVLNAVEKLHRDCMMLYGFRDIAVIPVFYYAFLELCETAYNLYRFLAEIHKTCEAARRLKKDFGIEIAPNPCEYVLDFRMELVIRDFRRAGRQLSKYLVFFTSEAAEAGKNFLDMLRSFSLTCSLATEGACLRYASRESVIPTSIRAYVSDLHSATERLSRRFSDLYSGVVEWRVGSIRLCEHPGTTPELSNLAEHAANILHKEATEIAPRHDIEEKVAVFSLRDRVAVGMREHGSIVVKPKWVMEVYEYGYIVRALSEGELKYINPVDVLKDILRDRGFKAEYTAYGLEVTMPPGDVMEALKIALILPSVPLIAETKEALYGDAISKIGLLESKLKEQRPLKKRRKSL